MTVGTLSRRTGVPVKLLREYEDAGLIYTAGRSEGNYRLFDDEALWCVEVITSMRGLGLTLAEIRELTDIYLHDEADRTEACGLAAERSDTGPGPDHGDGAAAAAHRRVRGKVRGRAQRPGRG